MAQHSPDGYTGRLSKQPYQMTEREMYGSPIDPYAGWRDNNKEVQPIDTHRIGRGLRHDDY